MLLIVAVVVIVVVVVVVFLFVPPGVEREQCHGRKKPRSMDEWVAAVGHWAALGKKK